MNPIFAALPTTIFEVISARARQIGAINLGQGFPEIDGFEDVRQAGARAILEFSNQYPPMPGLPELRQAVAAHYKRLQGLDLDWPTEVTITSGATEAIAASLLALIAPGDEVVLFEPLYDAYLPLVRRSGGTPKVVTLEPPEFKITEQQLANVFGPRTKLVLFNTPGNPAGRVFDETELAILTRACVRADAILVCDEVWEHIVFDGRQHLSPLALPDMRERCVKIGSAGKIFALTGWKVGFVCAAPALTQAIVRAHQFLTFTTAPNLQRAAAFGLALPSARFEEARAQLQRSRDRLAGSLSGAGLASLPCEGTYFLTLDLAASGVSCTADAFCRLAIEECGVAAIPYAAFYAGAGPARLVRVCFSKSDATLDEAAGRLAKARKMAAS